MELTLQYANDHREMVLETPNARHARRFDRPNKVGAKAPRHSGSYPLDSKVLEEVITAFRVGHGAIAADELAGLLRDYVSQPICHVARLIANRDILVLPWRGNYMVPIFQFDKGTWEPTANVRAVIHELRDVYNDHELYLWFHSENSWLEGRKPVDVVGTNPREVLDVARAERFICG